MFDTADVLERIWGQHGIHSLCWKAGNGLGSAFFENVDDLLDAADLRSGDLWFGVCALAERPSAGRGKADDVERVTCLFADLDWKSDAHAADDLLDEADTRALLDTFPMVPSIVIHTGHGLHVYWPLSVSVTASEGAALQRHLHDGLSAHGLSPERHDLASILRVPGSLNHKADPPRPVVIERFDQVIFDPEDVYAFADAEPEHLATVIELATWKPSLIPDVGAHPSGRKPRYNPKGLFQTMHAATEGNRNSTLNHVAWMAGRDIYRGKATEAEGIEAATELKRIALAKGLAPPEIDKTVQSGFDDGVAGKGHQ